ncbi:uncharacterized protein LOC111829440 [Capsella rubella]|uniref:uncharacterized protein LOC111829440 n=1 Tax=Capsella rubella TaxID=81985 RepID=UPI000CD4B1E3|nr:uncharacterized protein LOC111829440 [Capsella rubella]
MRTDSVADLNPSRTNWNIEAKILSIAYRRDFFMKRVLILADEKGDRIEATYVLKHSEKNIPKHVYEGVWYSIKDFRVIKPVLPERNTNHTYQIKVDEKTSMMRIAPLSSKEYYHFEDFSHVLKEIVPVDNSYDFYGSIIDVGELKEEDSKMDEYGNPYRVNGLVFQMINGRNERISCRIRGLGAHNFLREWRSKGYNITYKTHPVFCVLRFWRVSTYHGKPCITNDDEGDSGASRTFLNPTNTGLENHKISSEFAANYHFRVSSEE